MGKAANGCDQKPLWPSGQPEAAIKAVGGFRQIARPVFVKVKGVISTGQARLEISQHRIDPVEFGPLFGLFPADHEGLV